MAHLRARQFLVPGVVQGVWMWQWRTAACWADASAQEMARGPPGTHHYVGAPREPLVAAEPDDRVLEGGRIRYADGATAALTGEVLRQFVRLCAGEQGEPL